LEKSLGVGLKGSDAKMNWLAVNRQSYVKYITLTLTLTEIELRESLEMAGEDN
jgi:hypothetical protein